MANDSVAMTTAASLSHAFGERGGERSLESIYVGARKYLVAVSG